MLTREANSCKNMQCEILMTYYIIILLAACAQLLGATFGNRKGSIVLLFLMFYIEIILRYHAQCVNLLYLFLYTVISLSFSDVF